MWYVWIPSYSHRSRSRSPRKRSRSKERSRRHRSRSRSRDRSRDRRSSSSRKSKGNWDKAPTSDGAIAAANAAAQIAAIQQAGAPPGAVHTLMPMMPGSGMSLPMGNVGYQLPLPGAQPTLRQAKRIYVGNVQPHITEQMLRQFLNTVILSVPGRPPSVYPEPVNTITIKPDKMFAFVEFHNTDDADIAVCMDGIEWLGQQIKIRRPKDYSVPDGYQSKQYYIPGIISTHVENGPNKIFLGNLPASLSDQEVKDFVSSFGQLKAFSLVRDLITGMSKGYAFFSYLDVSITDTAIAGLNGISLGGKTIACQRGGMTSNAEQSQQQQHMMMMGGMPMSGMGGGMGMGMGMPMSGMNPLGLPAITAPSTQLPTIPSQPPSRYLILHNMVTADELKNEYDDIMQDVREECSKYGILADLFGKTDKIYVEYADQPSAEAACRAINGRKFASRTIIAAYANAMDLMTAKAM